MINNKRIGLALSGGGYRAAAFHMGTLRKLKELKILNKIDVLSTISGGSIAGAFYCLHRDDFQKFEKELTNILHTKSLIKYSILSITFLKALLFIILSWIIIFYLFHSGFLWLPIFLVSIFFYMLMRFQFTIFHSSKIIEQAYEKYFFNHAKLSDLPDYPELAIGSTNLQTARQFTFSKRKMGDSAYSNMSPPIYFKNENFPVARAVMASSCVPYAFNPLVIDKIFFENESDSRKIKPRLIDGGIYDNQGIHKLTQKGSSYECDIVITSDAGDKLPFKGSYNNTLILLIRTVEVFMARIKNFQMMNTIYNNIPDKEIAYLSLGWNLEESISGFITNLEKKNISNEVINTHGFEQKWLNDINLYRRDISDFLKQKINYSEIITNSLTPDELTIARRVKTNLTPLSLKEIDCLSRHASNMTELYIKLYCPSLIPD